MTIQEARDLSKEILHRIELEEPCFKAGSIENNPKFQDVVREILESTYVVGCTCKCSVCQMATHEES